MTWTFSPMAATVLPDLDGPPNLRRGYRCCAHCAKRRRWALPGDHDHGTPCLRGRRHGRTLPRRRTEARGGMTTGNVGLTCDNGGGPGGAGNTDRSLTTDLALPRKGLPS